jgi:hypothetical protein
MVSGVAAPKVSKKVVVEESPAEETNEETPAAE